MSLPEDSMFLGAKWGKVGCKVELEMEEVLPKCLKLVVEVSAMRAELTTRRYSWSSQSSWVTFRSCL